MIEARPCARFAGLPEGVYQGLEMAGLHRNLVAFAHVRGRRENLQIPFNMEATTIFSPQRHDVIDVMRNAGLFSLAARLFIESVDGRLVSKLEAAGLNSPSFSLFVLYILAISGSRVGINRAHKSALLLAVCPSILSKTLAILLPPLRVGDCTGASASRRFLPCPYPVWISAPPRNYLGRQTSPTSAFLSFLLHSVFPEFFRRQVEMTAGAMNSPHHLIPPAVRAAWNSGR